MSTYWINVAVATLWTNKDSSRSIDHAAITNPVSIRQWLNSQNNEMKLELCERNLVQSQALYGQEVIVLEMKDDWAFVVIPEQPTVKNENGYPGWMPIAQLQKKENDKQKISKKVTVVKSTANLYQNPDVKWMELSYQTTLPFLEEIDDHIKVKTPTGYGFLCKEDVHIFEAELAVFGTGEQIVSEAEKFIDLPYLWGGMSGFGFDCSGFSYTMCKAVGYTIPRDAHEQAKEGLNVDLNHIKPGDLLFFAYDEGKGHIHHVGIYYGNGQMIHSPKTGIPVEITDIKGVYEKELCVARRFWK